MAPAGQGAAGLCAGRSGVGVGDGWLLTPAGERLHTLEAQAVALQQDLTQKAGLADSLEHRARQEQVMQEAVGGLLRQLPGESDRPGLLDDIARLAAANGLVVEGVTVLDELSLPLFIEEPVQVAVFGAYHDLVTFVSALGGLSQIVTVHDVALRSDGPLVRLELLAKAYRGRLPGGKPERVVEPVAQFVYDATSLRDPFQPPASQAYHAPGQPAPAPDFARKRGVLEGLALDQVEMVGTLSAAHKPSSCCAQPRLCTAWRWVTTWAPTTAGSQPFMPVISSWPSCSRMSRAHGCSAREPWC